MATLTIVNDLLDKRFSDDGESDSANYRLGFICALEKNAGLAVGPCPFGPNSSDAEEWLSGHADGSQYWTLHSANLRD